METEFILSFQNGPRIFISQPMLPYDSKKEMIAFCKGMAAATRTTKLVKVVMCVMYGQNPAPKLPEWYEKCSGKLWEDELV